MKYFKTILALLVLAGSGVSVFAQSAVFTNDKNIAVNGYDVVAYFNQYDAVRGGSDNAVTHNKVTYYFSSAENAASFKENPSAYQPAYGGFCSFAVGMQGAKVPSDPKTFKIRDGKLYLFYNDYYEGKPFNTIVPWNGNEAEMVNKANTNWKKLK